MNPSSGTNQERKIAIVGAGGQIGSALFRILNTQGQNPLSWNWKNLPLSWDPPIDVVVASGLISPERGESALLEANLKIPQRIADSLKNPGSRILTIGTIQERFEEACQKNPYLHSKLILGKWMKQNWNGEGDGKCLHVRLHTVYSEKPKPHMFLGQIARALKENTPFEMSAGSQLREYHHVDDVAGAIAKLLMTEWHTPVVELSSGDPVKLSDLAQRVFNHFKKPELLKIGVKQIQQGENLNQIFSPSPPELFKSRDWRTGIILAMEKVLKE